MRVFECAYFSVYLNVGVSTCVCLFECVCVCVSACVCVYLSVCVCVYLSVCGVHPH